MIRDARQGARQLRRQPAFALGVLLSLALGIGVNVTVFRLANAVLFRAPQVAQPDDLVRLYLNAHSPLKKTAPKALRASRAKLLDSRRGGWRRHRLPAANSSFSGENAVE